MTTIRATRPDATEFAPYYGRYVDKPGDGDIVATLESDRVVFAGVLRSIPEDRAGHRYAEGKWSIRELLGHEQCRWSTFLRPERRKLVDFLSREPVADPLALQVQ